LVVTVASACGGSTSPGASRHAVATVGTPPVETPAVAAPVATSGTPPQRISIVAQARGPSVGVYRASGAPAPSSVLANPQPSGAPLVFLVQQTSGDWLKVLLPVRPNGSTGWIRVAEVTLSQHSFRIVIEESAHRITVYQGGTIFDQEPAGIGTRLTPTPGGLYYIKELLKPPDSNGPYGPYAYGLSGFSNVLTTFNGGDGVIGIHGTNDPSGLGRDVSHGCIRISNAGISKLAAILPLGVPVEIRP
jgi:lipoprotein-anchoring transpeptidase ErfK/SrfK